MRNGIAATHSERVGLDNPNFSTEGEREKEIFGSNIQRLREVKRKYDPGFVFKNWLPIKPAEA